MASQQSSGIEIPKLTDNTQTNNQPIEERELSGEIQVDSKAAALVGLNREILGALSKLQSSTKISKAVFAQVQESFDEFALGGS